MNPTAEVERRLHSAFDVEPSPDALQWLDQRVARAIAKPQPAWRGLLTTPLLRPIPLLAALIVGTGAVAGTLTLLDRTATESHAGWRAAWDRAQVLGVAHTDAGVTINLERAYVDVNGVLVGFSVEGLPTPEGAGEEQPRIEWTAELRDPRGRPAEEWATALLATSLDEPDMSAVVQSWEGHPAAEAGTWTLAVTSVGYSGSGFAPGACSADDVAPGCSAGAPSSMVEGSWNFSFDLPAPEGVMANDVVGATDEGITLTLDGLWLSPTMLSGRLGVSSDEAAIAQWSPTFSAIRHNGEPFEPEVDPNFTGQAVAPSEGGPDAPIFEFRTSVGTVQAGGSWEFEVAEIWYQTSASSEPVVVEGPWVLTVEVP